MALSWKILARNSGDSMTCQLTALAEPLRRKRVPNSQSMIT
ncbi:hypothetical protein RYX41_13620 [Lactiplantibacillus plantarum]|nr:hypothetical protein [Lactiplantibacillus plantarum]MDV2577168.1 hypothetical protein [Lactiplantibacillus plantarum]